MTPGRPARPGDGPLAANDEICRLKKELLRLEEELARTRASERMYRSSAELSGRLAWQADAQGRIMVMSPIFASVTGISIEESLGEGWLDVVPQGEARDAFRAQWLAAVRSGTPFHGEFTARLADGAMHVARSEAIPELDDEGRIVGWFGTTQNVTEEKGAEAARRDAEERLRLSEELHRYTLELSRQIAWTVEPDGTGLIMSARYEELTGLPGDDSAGESIHPEDRAEVDRRWQISMATGQPFAVECRLRMKDGAHRLFRVRATPRRGDDGAILRWYGITEDIHEQREADFALRDVAERYRLAGQATRDALWDHDFSDAYIDWSENAASVLGAGSGPLGRQPDSWWRERVHPDDAATVISSLQAAIDGEARRWTGTYRFRRDDGSYADVVDRGFIIRDDEGRAIRAVGAMTDLTVQNRAEAEIRRMQAELVHVSRLSAMGAMASTLAHELNQPLTALANYIGGAKRILEREGIGHPQLADALVSAEVGALRAGEIVRRLREFVSRGTVSIVVEPLAQLIEDAGVLAFVDEKLRGVSHRIELDPNAQFVQVDRVQIQQVLINLIRNAVEALEGCERREVIVSTAAVDHDMVEITITDTGEGIHPADLDSLFSEFMTTKSGGMGIGLPISRTIVEAHGGKIWAANRPEGGAVFRFTLPRASGPREGPRLF